MTSPTESSDRLIAQNRRAHHDFAILDTIEAGLVLAGTEVKSLRGGKASPAESFATIDNGEVFVRQMHIPPYEQGNRWNLDPVRTRKLLLHREEIVKLHRRSPRRADAHSPASTSTRAAPSCCSASRRARSRTTSAFDRRPRRQTRDRPRATRRGARRGTLRARDRRGARAGRRGRSARAARAAHAAAALGDTPGRGSAERRDQADRRHARAWAPTNSRGCSTARSTGAPTCASWSSARERPPHHVHRRQPDRAARRPHAAALRAGALARRRACRCRSSSSRLLPRDSSETSKGRLVVDANGSRLRSVPPGGRGLAADHRGRRRDAHRDERRGRGDRGRHRPRPRAPARAPAGVFAGELPDSLDPAALVTGVRRVGN